MARRGKARYNPFRTQGVVLGVVLLAVLTIAAAAYYIQAKIPAAMCVDCAPGYTGGGCAYTDKVGNVVQPERCVPYDTAKPQQTCTDESRLAEACIEMYQPVCGSDGRTYSNSCFACMNTHVYFYMDGAC